MASLDDRKEFLINMYNQMFNDINRHINIIWQPIATFIGSFVLLTSSLTNVIPIDLGISLIIVLDAWLLANLCDSAYWYNRNLAIITNIERQFLVQSDLHEIHYYFGKHRKKQSMMTHLGIQWWMGLFSGTTILTFHFFHDVWKSSVFLENATEEIRITLFLPYLVMSVAIIWLTWFKYRREKAYNEFLKNSPGKEIDTTGINFTGSGHPVVKEEATKESAAEAKNNFSPLSWSIALFSLWYTLMSIHANNGNWFVWVLFPWVLFAISIILLISAYCDWLYKKLSSKKSLKYILPIVFMSVLTLLVTGVLVALKDLNTVNQWIAIAVLFLITGTVIMCEVASIPHLGLRIVCCIVIGIAFILKLTLTGFMATWPLLIILGQMLWAALKPKRFARIPMI